MHYNALHHPLIYPPHPDRLPHSGVCKCVIRVVASPRVRHRRAKHRSQAGRITTHECRPPVVLRTRQAPELGQGERGLVPGRRRGREESERESGVGRGRDQRGQTKRGGRGLSRGGVPASELKSPGLEEEEEEIEEKCRDEAAQEVIRRPTIELRRGGGG